MKTRWQPSLQIIPHYESEPLYIDALVKSIENKIALINWEPDLIVASYHGIPKKYFEKGILITAIAIKPQGLLRRNFLEYQLKQHFNPDLAPKNGYNLILIKL